MTPTPAFIDPIKVQSGNNTTSLVSSAITVANGDVLVVKVATADQLSPSIGTTTGGSQTFTQRANVSISSKCAVRILTAVVTGSPGTVTVTQAFGGTGGYHSMVVERWTGAQLAATPATNGTTTGNSIGPSATLTTVAANSVVTWVDADWAARAPGVTAYRSSATEDGIHDGSTANYVAYFAWQVAATIGSQTIGLTTPATAQNWAMVGIEVQDAGGAPALPAPLIMQTRRAY